MSRKTPAKAPVKSEQQALELEAQKTLIRSEALKRVCSSDSLWSASVHSASIPRTARVAMNIRLDVPAKRSLDSMAVLLGKTPANLASEILRVAVIEFSDRLATTRKDLMADVGDDPEYPELIPRWIWPEQAYADYMREHPETFEAEDE